MLRETNRGSRRGDIQGLRGLAVIAVVAYHAGAPFMPGGFVGVDLFFVLSGFLITSLLLREIQTRGTIDLIGFWARRARRLIPASAVVLIATMLAARELIDPIRRGPIGVDAVWAALFSANWRFAQQQTDYLASERDPSPILHYWSLGVEEQFYLVWPLLLLVLLALVWRLGGSRRAVHPMLFGGAFVVVITTSLVYCILESSANQPYAFFGTPARAWQLAIGALTALAAPRLRSWRPAFGSVLGLIGLALLAVSVVFLSESGNFGGATYPSWLAVLPTLAAVLLVASGTCRSSWLTRSLAVRPLAYVGDISYSLYLWHWPVLVLGMEALGTQPAVRLALVASALGLSILTFHLVENPVRRAPLLVTRPRVSIAFGALLVAAVLPTVFFAVSAAPPDRIVVDAAFDEASQGLTEVTPSLADAVDDASSYKDDGCHVSFDVTQVPSWDRCTYADRDADRTAVVLGDSIAGAVAPAVIKAGENESWAVTVWAKNNCQVADVTTYDPRLDGPYRACDTFRAAAIAAIVERRPDVVVLSMSRGSTRDLWAEDSRVGGTSAIALAIEGLSRTVRKMRSAGIGVVLVDSPTRAPFETISCLSQKKDARRCTFAADPQVSVMRTVAERMDDEVAFVAANRTVCPEGTCRPVVGKVVVYRDKVHFTRTFAETLAPEFGEALPAADVG